MLVLPIKKKWFDMILSGEKKEFLLKFFNYMTEVTVNIMTAIMCIAPLGVLA